MTDATQCTEATPLFGPLRVVEPESPHPHTHTAILLHGRGSSGPEFAKELASSKLKHQKTMMRRLPTWKWVFPSSREQWSPTFQQILPAWFEAPSLMDVTIREDLQMDGIRAAVGYIRDIVREEVAKLNGHAEKVVLGGISQGGAVAQWTLLCWNAKSVGCLGGFVGMSTWLPLASNVEEFLKRNKVQGEKLKAEEMVEGGSPSDEFVEEMMTAFSRDGPLHPVSDISHQLCNKVFMGHGIDDMMVSIDLGRQARSVLAHAGLNVECKEYSGAMLDGHWLKIPDEVDDITDFLAHVEDA